MKRIFTYEITESDTPITILNYLKRLGYSQPVLRHLKETPQGILRNGIWARVPEVLSPGDILTINLIEESASDILPTPIALDIVYEDEDLLIINKPAKMPVHPSQGNHTHTLANALAYYFQKKGDSFVFRCMNRLDRDTTGLLIVAKHMLSAAILSVMTSQREIHREYRAITLGEVPKEGTITAPIARVHDSTIERCVNHERGEYACTHYKRLAYQNGYSLVSLHLETGRTHQIRVHMKHIGHPLPGDFLYNPDFSVINRQALHSYRLQFKHPITGEEMEFTAELPEDMKKIIVFRIR